MPADLSERLQHSVVDPERIPEKIDDIEHNYIYTGGS